LILIIIFGRFLQEIQMETTQTSTIVSGETRSGWRKTDTMWMLGLYGTAIGAGVLFLPINAGVGGMIP
jgi:serine transporter